LVNGVSVKLGVGGGRGGETRVALYLHCFSFENENMKINDVHANKLAPFLFDVVALHTYM
jgi:hypothetical protein